MKSNFSETRPKTKIGDRMQLFTFGFSYKDTPPDGATKLGALLQQTTESRIDCRKLFHIDSIERQNLFKLHSSGCKQSLERSNEIPTHFCMHEARGFVFQIVNAI